MYSHRNAKNDNAKEISTNKNITMTNIISIITYGNAHTISHCLRSTDVNAVMKQNFVFRMLFTDIY